MKAGSGNARLSGLHHRHSRIRAAAGCVTITGHEHVHVSALPEEPKGTKEPQLPRKNEKGERDGENVLSAGTGPCTDSNHQLLMLHAWLLFLLLHYRAVRARRGARVGLWAQMTENNHFFHVRFGLNDYEITPKRVDHVVSFNLGPKSAFHHRLTPNLPFPTSARVIPPSLGPWWTLCPIYINLERIKSATPAS